MPDPNRPLLTPAQLLDGWTPRRVGRRILTLAETDSTNNVVAAAAGDPDADGLAVFADYQAAGRGRLGRAWLAPRGGSVLCSILLRASSDPSAPAPLSPCDRAQTGDSREPRASARAARPHQVYRQIANGHSGDTPAGEGAAGASGQLTLASAVAVCEAIRRATDVTPAIKWPNDLRVAGRKLAGILIESRAIDPQTRAWVIGIGINCYQQPGHFPPELRATATSLDLVSNHPVDRAAVARELLKALDEAFCAQSADSPDAVYAKWLAHAEPLGQSIRLRSEGRDYTGLTVSVDPAGGLIVQCDDGRQRWFDPLVTTVL